MNGITDNAKLYVVEERVNGHENRIERLEETIPVLSRLEAILEAQVEINRAQSASIELSNKSSEKTFQAINQNLTKLNMVTERLKEDLDKSNNQSEYEIEELRKRMEEEANKRKIDTSDWGVKIFYWVVMAIATLLMGWVTFMTGWG